MVALDTTPRQAIERLERDLGLTPQDLCGALNISRRTLERWRNGEAYPQRESREKLAELIELNEYFQDGFVSPEDTRQWVHSKSRYLKWATPAEMIRLGKFDQARGALVVIEHGIYL